MSRLFNESKASRITRLSKRSDEILDVFTKTQLDCKEVNEEISQSIDEHNAEIAALQENVNTLQGIHGKNKKLHDKIDQFLNS